ncbi:MAG: hypothetical protein ACI9CO_002505, partial [Candidatus Azotimanducaceae bacterium]
RTTAPQMTQTKRVMAVDKYSRIIETFCHITCFSPLF